MYKVGDQVIWISGAQGVQRKKSGFVECVIPAGKRPTVEQSKEADAYGASRDHESYLVRVPGKTAPSKGKLYWPRVSQLQLATEFSMTIEEAMARANSWIESPEIRPESATVRAVSAALLMEIKMLRESRNIVE